jgi:hypothetical protein
MEKTRMARGADAGACNSVPALSLEAEFIHKTHAKAEQNAFDGAPSLTHTSDTAGANSASEY